MADVLSRRLFCAGLSAGAAALGVRGARAVLSLDLAPDREAATVRALAKGVLGWTRRALAPSDFATGSTRFSGEWVFGTLMMAALGLTQLAEASPALRPDLVLAVEGLVDVFLGAEARAFSRDAWRSDPIDASGAVAGSEAGHAAYLGYAGLAIGALRRVSPSTRHARLGERVAEALRARVDRSPLALVETYPGETYPVDNAAALAAIHLDEAARGLGRSSALARGLVALDASIDQATGLLVQAVDPATGAPRDAPRGSGTCLGVYFSSFVDRARSRRLWQAVKRELVGQVLGFRVVREYARGAEGRGDIDSGPVICGFGVSASGFALGAARVHGDRELGRELYATASLFGAPSRVSIDAGPSAEPDGLRFVTGGPLGDALLLAMLTAGSPVHDLGAEDPS